MNTHASVVDVLENAVNTHTTIANVLENTMNANTTMDDVVENLLRIREEIKSQNQAVSDTRVY